MKNLITILILVIVAFLTYSTTSSLTYFYDCKNNYVLTVDSIYYTKYDINEFVDSVSYYNMKITNTSSKDLFIFLKNESDTTENYFDPNTFLYKRFFSRKNGASVSLIQLVFEDYDYSRFDLDDLFMKRIKPNGQFNLVMFVDKQQCMQIINRLIIINESLIENKNILFALKDSLLWYGSIPDVIVYK